MNYIGNIPELNIVHTDSDRYDYVFASNPTIDINPSVPYATWLNITSGELFICTSNTVDENSWRGQNGSSVNLEGHIQISGVDALHFTLPAPLPLDSTLSLLIDITCLNLEHSDLIAGTLGWDSFRAHLYNGNGDIYVGVAVESENRIIPDDVSTQVVESERFTFCYGYSSTTNQAVLYYDGVEVASKTFLVEPVAITSFLCSGLVSARFYSVSILSRQITIADAIDFTENKVLTSNRTGIVGEYLLNDGSGTFLEDTSGNSYHGLLEDESYWGV